MPDSAVSRNGRSTPPPAALSTSTPSTPKTVRGSEEPITSPLQPARLRGARGSLSNGKNEVTSGQSRLAALPASIVPAPPEERVVSSQTIATKLKDEEELDDFGLAVMRRNKTKVEEGGETLVKETEENDGSDDDFESADEGEEDSTVDAEADYLDGKGPSHDAKGKGRVVNTARISLGAEGDGLAKDISKGESGEVHQVKDKEDRVNASLELDEPREDAESAEARHKRTQSEILAHIIEAGPDNAVGGVSGWSHQALMTKKVEDLPEEEEAWQQMPAYGKYDLYDDDGRLVARANQDSDEDEDNYGGGARKGYTRVQIDEDAQSATSMDENTSYLFKDKGTNVQDEHEEARDPLAQMQATKDLLTEGQRIAYVGVTRLSMVKMTTAIEGINATKGVKKDFATAIESMKMWSQKMMVRLYAHMEISSSEQIMIEQLAEHGVQPEDLTPALMQNSRVKNPMAAENAASSKLNSGQPSRTHSFSTEPKSCESPPPYELHNDDELPEVRSPGMLPATENIDLDLRWTVLCDLFLVLIADSIYDSRSRVLLEIVGAAMDIKWIDICRFEKRVTDALEMQEQANRENWDEAEHMESRRKMALKRRYMIMGLATVGGSLVIGLSAGLLAPVIGAGLAAGFTTIGVAGTSGFLAGAGGAAIITTGSAISGGVMGIKASNRRMGAVRTFEYRPLHNNKRVNLIVTVSGWMNGKVDDVRLPFSTVDPIMGDIYSVLWEPDMLQSTGETVRILATEALTQGLQQVLASTILTGLMASLSLPIVLSKLAYLLDNPWSVSLDRADAAGLILADSLIDHNLGVRPITLVGFSLGSRLIFSCLKEMARKGAYGLIQNVYLFGSPIVAKKDEYLRARTVVSGRFVNAYAKNDWIIGYLFRATSGGIGRVSGLGAVLDIPGLENFDVTSLVPGHMAYRAAMPRLLREVGWEVESDEFSEIEDPDPENHERRQRELIREIEDARKEAGEEGPNGAGAKKKKGGFAGFWRRGVKPKKGWETYEEGPDDGSGKKEGDPKETYNPVLFDIDAIRAELESEQLEVRQLESTLPPMRLDLNPPPYSMASNGKESEPAATKSAPTGQMGHGVPEPSRPAYDNWEEYEEHEGQLAGTVNGNSSGGVTMSFEPTTEELPIREIPSKLDGGRLGPFGGSTAGSVTTTPAISPSLDEGVKRQAGMNTNGAEGNSQIKEEDIRPSMLSASPGDFHGGMDLGHNAWAEEDDVDEFGQGKGGGGEMQMTFE